MTSMASITVKKADGTTDITYSALTASAGDGVAAQWRSETAGSQVNAKPTLSMVSQYNGNRTARRIDLSFKYPQAVTDSTTSVVSVANTVPLSMSITIPLGVPDSIVAEAVAQATNLLHSTLIVDSLKAGYAPT
jgi:hypothetical protein